MKTIKELETEIYEAQSCDEVDVSAYVNINITKIQTLKDVLKLIDEMQGNAIGLGIDADEFRKIITGEQEDETKRLGRN